ncbi:MAG: hypothetical protein OHK0021_07550 [Bryobacter sp.]
MKFFAAILLCFCAPAGELAWAQAPEVAFPVASVRVDGLRQLREEQVVAASGLPVGAKATKKDFDAAMQRLLATGYLDRVGYRYEPVTSGYALTWEVQEVSVFYPVSFPDLQGKEAEAKAALTKTDPLFGDKIPATDEVLRRYARALNDTFGLKAEDDVLRGKVVSNDAGELRIEFRATKPLPTVYKVDFRGNKLLPGEELRVLAAASAVGLVWDEAAFRKVLELRITPVYEARGRLRVRYPKIEATPSPGLNAVDVMVEVEEGEEYKLRKVSVEGLGKSNEEMLRAGEFQEDLPANMTLVAEGAKKIEAAVRRNGYLDARVNEVREVDDAAKAVDVELIVEPGARYSFEALEIRGLDIISEPAIRKMWKMERGDPFNPEYPDQFLERIRTEGILDNLGNTRSRYQFDESTRGVTVTLTFEGEKPKPDKRRP